MLIRLVAVMVACSVTLASSLGQVTQSPSQSSGGYNPQQSDSWQGQQGGYAAYRRDHQGDGAQTQEARSNRAYAEYMAGREYEYGSRWRRPDLNAAVQSYARAMEDGSLNGLYRLGFLMTEGKASVRDSSGAMVHDPAQGRKMMHYAMSQGYSPATDTVRVPVQRPTPRPAPSPTPSSGSSDSQGITAGEAFVGLGLLGLLAAALGSSDSKTGTTPSTGGVDTTAQKTCRIPHVVQVTNPPGSTYHYSYETQYTTGYGLQCP